MEPSKKFAPERAAATKARKLYSSIEMIQQKRRQKRLLSGDGVPSILPKLVPNMSEEEIVNNLRLMSGMVCATNTERFHLLQRRDELMSKLRDLLSSGPAGTQAITQGTCPDMCPEKERYMRDVKKSLHFYECDSKGQMVHEKMVKDYSRSAADQDMPLAHDLRPLDALQATMDYLIFNIAAEMPNTNTELARWYDFLWSRTRAIRKDITQQSLQNESAVDLVEKCVRLHIFASFRLGFLDADLFDHKINTENLSKSMQTLRHLYEDLAKKQRYCPNESEFRSYDIILNLADFNVHNQVLAYRQALRDSAPVQFALQLASTLQNNNFVRFFRLVRHQATFLQACLCFQFFPHVRSSALKIIGLAYYTFPLARFIENLAFDSQEQAMTFLRAFRVELDPTDATLINAREARNVLEQPSGSAMPQLASAWIERKTVGSTLAQILCNNPSASDDTSSSRASSLVNSFAAGTSAYVNDPVLTAFLKAHGIGLDPGPAASLPPLVSATTPTRLNGSSRPVLARQEKPILPSGFSFARVLQQFQQPSPPKIYGQKFIENVPTASDGFASREGEALLGRVIARHLGQIAGQMLQQERAVQIKLAEIRAKLRRIWLRPFFSHWLEFARRRRLSRQFDLAESLLEEIVLEQLGRVATRTYREAHAFWRHQLANAICLGQGEALLERVLDEQLGSIACRIRATQMHNIQQRLAQIRANLYQKWLRQFTDHWLAVVRRNRLLRSITTRPDSSIDAEEGGRLSSPTKRFFHPGLKKLTPERMREMAEEKLRERERKRRREEEEEEESRALTNGTAGHGHGEEQPLAFAIRDAVLDGVSFSGDSGLSTSNGGLVEPGSQLHLFRPGLKQARISNS